MDDEAPKMKSVKKMYEDLTTAPARPSLSHDTKAMNMADKMFTSPSKAKQKFNDGGVVGNSNYPFGQSQAASSAPATPVGLGNNSPLVQVSTPGAAVEEAVSSDKPFGMKKGGKVQAVRRGDGIAQRGKTRGRMV